jgi:CelD/BcsL family acetyltransferase involved in cellulose biosynthesis
MLEIVVHDDIAQDAGLKADWARLLTRVPRHSGSQTFDFARCAWDAVPKGPAVRLAVVSVRRDGALKGLWPLYVYRQGGVRIASHLGYGAFEDYAGPIVDELEPDPEAELSLLRAAKGLADVLRVYNVLHGTRAFDLVANDRGFRRQGRAPCAVAALHGQPDFDTWAKKLSKKFRFNLRYARRKMEAEGEVAFVRMAGPVDGPRCVDRMFEIKLPWLRGRGIHWSWMYERQGRDFLRALAALPASPGGAVDPVEAYGLTLDGEIIAATVLFNSPDRMEYAVTAYDLEKEELSPGNLLIQECVMLAIRRNVDLDFRIGDEAYKMRWKDRFDLFETFAIACTPLGHAEVAKDIAAKRIRRFRAKWGPIVKGRLRALRAGKSAAESQAA